MNPENIKETPAELIARFKGNVNEKILESVNTINSILPLIAQTGYVLKEMYVVISEPQGINMSFEKTLDTSRETIDKILKAHKDKEILRMIVNALVTADDYQKKIKLGNIIFTGIFVDISMPPRISIKFRKK